MKGFTLLETVLAGGIAFFAGILLLSILINNSGFFSRQSSYISEGLSLNDALHQIDKHLREAVLVAEQYPLEDADFTSGSESLVLKLPSFDSNGVINNVYDYAVVAKDGASERILRLLVYPDPLSRRLRLNLVLTTMLNSIAFEYFDKNGNVISPNLATKVRVDLSVISKTGSGEIPNSSSIETSLRNYAF